jgi:hypothetical protein
MDPIAAYLHRKGALKAVCRNARRLGKMEANSLRHRGRYGSLRRAVSRLTDDAPFVATGFIDSDEIFHVALRLRDGTLLLCNGLRDCALVEESVGLLEQLGRPAQFGDLMTGTDVVDEAVRCGVDVLASEFDLVVVRSDMGTAQVVTTLQEGCVESVFADVRRDLSARLFPFVDPSALILRPYKLHIYKVGGHFKGHVDTPHDSLRQVATLVLQLPSGFKGGELVVTHGGKTQVMDGSVSLSRSIKWVALFPDCTHSVNRVTSGVRLTVSVEVLLDVANEAALRCVATQGEVLAQQFAATLSRSVGVGGRLGMFCSHVYTMAAANAQILRGADAIVRDEILRSFPTWTVTVLPVMVTHDVVIESTQHQGIQSGTPPRDSLRSFVSSTDVFLLDNDVLEGRTTTSPALPQSVWFIPSTWRSPSGVVMQYDMTWPSEYHGNDAADGGIARRYMTTVMLIHDALGEARPKQLQKVKLEAFEPPVSSDEEDDWGEKEDVGEWDKEMDDEDNWRLGRNKYNYKEFNFLSASIHNMVDI